MYKLSQQLISCIFLILGLVICNKSSAELTETDIQSIVYYCSDKVVAANILNKSSAVKDINDLAAAYQVENYGLAIKIFSKFEKLGCQTSAYYAHYASLAYMIDNSDLGDKLLLKSIELSKGFSDLVDSGIFLETRVNYSGALKAYVLGLNQFNDLLNQGSYDLSNAPNIVRVDSSTNNNSRFDDTFLLNGICLARFLGESQTENNFLMTLKRINHQFLTGTEDSAGIGPILTQHCGILDSVRPQK